MPGSNGTDELPPKPHGQRVGWGSLSQNPSNSEHSKQLRNGAGEKVVWGAGRAIREGGEPLSGEEVAPKDSWIPT